VEEDQSKTTFAIEWGSFSYTMMPFGMKNVPTVFSNILVAGFKEFIHKFLEVNLDDWIVFSLLKEHIHTLRFMWDRCHILLNLKKCISCTSFGILLGHVVCKDGLLVDQAKIVSILDIVPPTSVHKLHRTLGHT
jgi:hypothetical protein